MDDEAKVYSEEEVVRLVEQQKKVAMVSLGKKILGFAGLGVLMALGTKAYTNSIEKSTVENMLELGYERRDSDGDIID